MEIVGRIATTKIESNGVPEVPILDKPKSQRLRSLFELILILVLVLLLASLWQKAFDNFLYDTLHINQNSASAMFLASIAATAFVFFLLVIYDEVTP